MIFDRLALLIIGFIAGALSRDLLRHYATRRKRERDNVREIRRSIQRAERS